MENFVISNAEENQSTKSKAQFEKYLEVSKMVKEASTKMNQSLGSKEPERMLKEVIDELTKLLASLPTQELTDTKTETTTTGRIFRVSFEDYHARLYLTSDYQLRGFFGQIDTSYLTVEYFKKKIASQLTSDSASETSKYTVSLDQSLSYCWSRSNETFSSAQLSDTIVSHLLDFMIAEKEKDLKTILPGITIPIVNHDEQ